MQLVWVSVDVIGSRILCACISLAKQLATENFKVIRVNRDFAEQLIENATANMVGISLSITT